MTETAESLLAKIDQFVRDTGISEESLGWKACGDGRVVNNLRQGKQITLKRYDQLRQTMAAERQRLAAEAKDESGQGSAA